MVSVPAVMVVEPVRVLTANKVKPPGPLSVSVPAPEITPDKVCADELL